MALFEIYLPQQSEGERAGLWLLGNQEWHAGLGAGTSWLPVPPPSQQCAEAINEKAKTDVRRGRKLKRRADVLLGLVDATKVWGSPLHPADEKRAISQ